MSKEERCPHCHRPMEGLGLETTSKLEAEVRAVWPLCQKAAQVIAGKTWGKMAAATERLLVGCLRDARRADPKVPAECLAWAIRGAWLSMGAGTNKAIDAKTYIRTSTVYQQAKFHDYVALGREYMQKALLERAKARRDAAVAGKPTGAPLSPAQASAALDAIVRRLERKLRVPEAKG